MTPSPAAVPGARVPLLPTPEVLLLAIAFFTGIGQVRDFDIWWHLKAGQEILATGQIPTADGWSFTATGKPWFAHEWGAEVILFSIYRWAGENGLLIWKALMGLATLALLSRLYRRRDPTGGAAYLAGLIAAIVCVHYHLLERPHLFTNLFLALQVWCLERWLQGGRDRLTWLVPAYLLWANLHGGAVVGLATFGLYAAGQAVSWAGGDVQARVRFRRILLVAGLCLAATLVNPRGFHLLVYPLEYAGAGTLAAEITEWTSPDFREFKPMEVLALLLLATMLRVRTGATPTELILALAGMHLFLQSKRNIVFVALFVLPIAVERLRKLADASPLWQRFARADRPGSGWGFLGLFVAAVSLHTLLLQPPRLSRDYYPERAVEYLREAELGDVPMLNEFVYGGYFVWHLHPRYRVFIDSRTDLFFQQNVFAEYLSVFKLAMGWREVLDKWGIGLAAFERGHPLATVLAETGEWSEIYGDSLTTIWRRHAASPGGTK